MKIAAILKRLASAFSVSPPVSKKGKEFMQKDPGNPDRIIDFAHCKNRKLIVH